MRKVTLFSLWLVLAVGTMANGESEDKASALPAGICLVRSIPASGGTSGRVIVFADKDRQLVTTTANAMRAWEVSTGKELHFWPGKFQAIAVSADQRTLAAMDEKKAVHLFDVVTGQKQWQFRFTEIKPFMGGWPNDTAVLSFSPNGKKMAVGCLQDIEIWDLATRKFMHRFQRETGYRFGIVDFFPDNRRIVVTGFPTYLAPVWDTEIKEWDFNSWMDVYNTTALLEFYLGMQQGSSARLI